MSLLDDARTCEDGSRYAPRMNPWRRVRISSDARHAVTSREYVLGVLGGWTLVLLAGCGGGADRPSDETWQRTWDSERQLVPDAETVLAGGQDLCDDLVGQLRVSLPELIPTPTEALDDAVRAWINHAETIAFECRTERSELESQLDTLEVLAAEIDAGLAADEAG